MNDILGNFVPATPLTTSESERSRLLRETKYITHLPQPKGNTMQVEIKCLTTGAIIPTRATDGSAGYDLYLPKCELTEPLRINPNEILPIHLGFAIYINNRNVALTLLPRSSTGKIGLMLANTVGVVDSDYQGEVVLLAYNRDTLPIYLERDKAIAQMIFTPVLLPDLIEVDHFSDTTQRGAGSFGSTDIARNIQV